ncbi:hypothetical protein [Paraburkholderia sp. 32]|uniref:hypothetical protein n=1 Tax=Paraburkholderia sp. 32 TaxID=2991057 RepID=UPI003D20F9D8
MTVESNEVDRPFVSAPQRPTLQENLWFFLDRVPAIDTHSDSSNMRKAPPIFRPMIRRVHPWNSALSLSAFCSSYRTSASFGMQLIVLGKKVRDRFLFERSNDLHDNPLNFMPALPTHLYHGFKFDTRSTA